MSTRLKQSVSVLLWLAGLAALVIILMLFLNRPLATPTAQEAGTATPLPAATSVSPLETPTPLPSEPPPTPEPDPTEPPTPTNAPVPTSLPTPVVTPIPTAVPPIIPLPTDEITKPYTIVFREGNVIKTIGSDGTNEQILDIQGKTSLYLVSDRFTGIRPWEWGCASPNGDQLVVVLSNFETSDSVPKDEVPEFSLYLLDLATSNLQLLVQNGLAPVWSPDGSRIAYRSTQTSGLWTVDVASGEVKEIYAVAQANEHFVTDIDWSPDGQRLVFMDEVFGGPYALMVIPADGSGDANNLFSLKEYPISFPQWSPDGSQIMFVSLAGDFSEPSIFYNLWTVNSDGTNQTQLTQNMNLSAGLPSWSPDGLWIAFTGTNDYEATEPSTDLWLINRSSLELRRLTSTVDTSTNEWMPAWSPDGTQIIFNRDRSEVWQMSLADGMQTKLGLTPEIADFIILP